MITPVPLDDVDAMLKRLHLPIIRRLYADLAVRAEQEGTSYRTFLEVLCAEEIAHRVQTCITRAVRKARFPYLRTIEEFDFTYQTSVRMQMLGTLFGLELVGAGRWAIISGAPGRGKTHLAVAIAYRAIQNGFGARFITADELIGDLTAAVLHGDPMARWSRTSIRTCSLSTSSATRAMLTTNKPLAALGQVVHNGDLAEAILDRLLERGTRCVLRGRSYRIRHLKEDQHRGRRRRLSPTRCRQSLERNCDRIQRTRTAAATAPLAGRG
jgi:DNA replication protein DnaC